jgi:putative ABC transport system ATP-binding protein
MNMGKTRQGDGSATRDPGGPVTGALPTVGRAVAGAARHLEAGGGARVDTDGHIVRAERVVKTYDTGTSKVQALREVDLAIARGEMMAVMGPSGCGKTTLLNCLSGLDEVTSGQVWLEGKDLAHMSDKERTDYRARRMGFIFQVYNLLPVLNAVENVELPLLVSGMGPKEARERSSRALATVGLADWAKHRPAELSGGQRQRVTIARALVNDPAIVWADEPTGALDSTTADDIMGLMRDLNQRAGLTLVIVTHDPGVGQRCDRIVQMRDGQIIGDVAESRQPSAVSRQKEDGQTDRRADGQNYEAADDVC